MLARDRYAQEILRTYHEKILNKIRLSPHAQMPTLIHPHRGRDETITVGIIGAGAAGLFAAITLEELVKLKKYNFKYEILEAESARSAGGQHPFGGRLYTTHFAGGAQYDYYDVGAMRYPKIPPMQPVFDLFDYLGLVEGQDLIPYILSIPENFNFFSGKILTNKQVEEEYKKGNFDPFGTGVKGITGSIDDMVNSQIGEFRARIKKNSQEGWDYLMEYDRYSTRSYMARQYSEKVITYLETFSTGTSLFNQALTETVMDSLAFDYEEGVEWRCINGGSGKIAEAMVSKLNTPIRNGSRVTTLAPKPDPDSSRKVVDVAVTCADGYSNTYSHVISTVPFSCFRNIDTSGFQDMSWTLQTAIRALNYDASTKIAIKFTRRWWEDSKFNQKGGVSNTDRPTRVVVYPSYGIGTISATMIVSYTWSQDALRFGSSLTGSAVSETLKEVILRDLADIHRITDYTYLPGLVSKVDGWSWYNYENSGGAFALFGPGQFTSLYPEVTKPLNGTLHFAGEATSVHHAWLTGSLHSAFRAVLEIGHEEFEREKFEEFKRDLESLWPNIKEFDTDLLAQQVALGQQPAVFKTVEGL